MKNYIFTISFFMFFAMRASTQTQYTGTVILPGATENEARSYVYRIHPSFCSCKRLCMSGCASSMCASCTKAIQSICTIMIDAYSDVKKCETNAGSDLRGELKLDPTKTQEIGLSFSQARGFDVFHLYQVGNYLNSNLPNYFDCKKICNNLDNSSSEDDCRVCRNNVCSPNSACSLAGSDLMKCQSTCMGDLQFYDNKIKDDCLIDAIDCTSVSVNFAKG